MKSFDYIEIQQPIGTFYLCCINAAILLKYVSVAARGASPNGVQRGLIPERVKEIGQYCSDPDAIFPTPIVVSINADSSVKLDEKNHKIVFCEEKIVGDVIDGQHRLWGIQKSDFVDAFNLPVVLMFNLTMEEKAYIFSTINSNQKKVDKSLIFDLFDVSNHRSPYKTAHQIARAMNYDPSSPLYNRLKMLGKKTPLQKDATLSQGTFAKSIVMLLSKKPELDTLKIKRDETLLPDDSLPFRQYFIDNQDNIILKIIMNCFSAVKDIFPEEWERPNDNILWKTTGFKAIMYVLPSLIRAGQREMDLSKDYFLKCFNKLKVFLKSQDIYLTSEFFPGGSEQVQKKLASKIWEAMSAKTNEDAFKKVIEIHDIQEYINGLNDPDKYELYDLVVALETGVPSYGTVNVEYEDNDVVLKCAYQDVQCRIPKKQAKEYARFIEDTYMGGEDAEIWLNMQNHLEHLMEE